MKSSQKIIWLLIILIAGSFIAYGIFNKFVSDPQKKYVYYTVKKNDLHISIKEKGTLKAINQHSIKNKLSGKSVILSIIPEGSSVKKGQLLVELDPAETMKQLAQIQIEVETSKSSYITAKNDLSIEESTVASEQRTSLQETKFAEMDLKKFIELDKNQQIREAESKITTEEESLRLAQEKFRWSEKLTKKGFETKSQLDRDRLELINSKKKLDSAKSKLIMLKKFDLPKKEEKLKSAVAEANKKNNRLTKQGESKIRRAKGQRDAAKRKLDFNTAQLIKIKAQLKHTKLYAPVDGIALYPTQKYNNTPPLSIGSPVTNNKEIIYIPGLNKMKVEIKVPELHISKIKTNQEALITLDSISNKQYKATVSKVSHLPDRHSYWTAGQNNYITEITINDSISGVKPSISATAEITIANLKNVISIPIQAIKSKKDKYICFIKKGDKHIETEISLGLMNNSHVEVTSGLKSGDTVLLNIPVTNK